MSRPFVFRINAAELFTEIHMLDLEQKAKFLTQFSTDLLTLDPVTTYAKRVIADTMQLIEKRSECGKLGGRPKKQSLSKKKQSLTIAKAPVNILLKQEEEVEVKEEVKKETKTDTTYMEILEDLNQKGGYRYRLGEGIKKEINGRMSEGYTKEDFFHVHSVMISKWKDDETMCQYLRPDTLYRASKFPGYLNMKLPESKCITPDWL